MQDDHSHERALAQLEELMSLRPIFLDHKSVLVSIDHAIGNVFEPRNHDEIGKHITKIKELVDLVAKMNNLRVGSTGIRLPLPNLHVSEAKPQYQKVNAKYEKLKKIRHRLAVLGIPTVGIEAAMVDILMPKDVAAPVAKVLEEPAIVKQQPPSSGIKSELSKHVLCQSAGHNVITPAYTAGTTSTMKRSAPVDEAGDANLGNVFKDEGNETKRRKASLNVSSRLGKECTEAWRVPVNEVATRGLRLVSKESNKSLLLFFDTKAQSIVVVFKEQCLSAKYPSLELMPSDIHAVTRNSLRTKKYLRARLFTRDYQDKYHIFDVIFPSNKDYETFLDKIRFSCYCEISSRLATGNEMEKMFEEGLWLKKETRISGTVMRRTRTMEIVELE